MFKYLSRDFDPATLQKQYELHWDLLEYKYFTGCRWRSYNFNKKEDFDGWAKDLFAIKSKNELAGFIYLDIGTANHSVDISIFLFKKWLNSGLGVKAMLEVVNYIFHRGYHRINFSCAEGNKVAKKIYDSSIRIGGRYIGHTTESFVTMTGELVNLHLYEILKKKYKPLRRVSSHG